MQPYGTTWEELIGIVQPCGGMLRQARFRANGCLHYQCRMRRFLLNAAMGCGSVTTSISEHASDVSVRVPSEASEVAPGVLDGGEHEAR